MIRGVVHRSGTLLASSERGEVLACKRAIGLAVIKVWWADDRVTESVCASWGRCIDVVSGNAHPFRRWEIRAA